jgi:copper chaperone
MTLQLKVLNMGCSACGNKISKAVKTVDPTAIVQTEPKTKIVLVETIVSEITIREALSAAGYPAVESQAH